MNHNPEQSLKTYLVGGAVRDKLLGFESADQDWVVVGSSPQEMLSLGFEQVGKDFPVFLHPVTHEEYALARIEKKTKPGHQGFAFQYDPKVSLEEDLKRRDLTINAIAMASDGHLIDPYQGQQDLQKKILRHVSPAFREDPLRVLRVARFAARFYDLAFTIAPETVDLMREISASSELNSLSAERIWRELNVSFSLKHPSVFINILQEVGALRTLIPEYEEIADITRAHMSLTLNFSAAHNDPAEIRFASLMIPLSRTPSGIIFYQAFCKRIKPPQSFGKLAELAIVYSPTIQKKQDSAQSCLELLNKLDAYRSPDRFAALLQVCSNQAQTMRDQAAQTYTEQLAILFKTTQVVKAQPFLEQGFLGLDLRAAMDAEKIRLIEKNIH